MELLLIRNSPGFFEGKIRADKKLPGLEKIIKELFLRKKNIKKDDYFPFHKLEKSLITVMSEYIIEV
ncbi:MAG: hypothetical protein ACOC56_05890 [Atribacterota bacterium]